MDKEFEKKRNEIKRKFQAEKKKYNENLILTNTEFFKETQLWQELKDELSDFFEIDASSKTIFFTYFTHDNQDTYGEVNRACRIVEQLDKEKILKDLEIGFFYILPNQEMTNNPKYEIASFNIHKHIEDLKGLVYLSDIASDLMIQKMKDTPLKNAISNNDDNFIKEIPKELLDMLILKKNSLEKHNYVSDIRKQLITIITEEIDHLKYEVRKSYEKIQETDCYKSQIHAEWNFLNEKLENYEKLYILIDQHIDSIVDTFLYSSTPQLIGNECMGKEFNLLNIFLHLNKNPNHFIKIKNMELRKNINIVKEESKKKDSTIDEIRDLNIALQKNQNKDQISEDTKTETNKSKKKPYPQYENNKNPYSWNDVKIIIGKDNNQKYNIVYQGKQSYHKINIFDKATKQKTMFINSMLYNGKSLSEKLGLKRSKRLIDINKKLRIKFKKKTNPIEWNKTNQSYKVLFNSEVHNNN